MRSSLFHLRIMSFQLLTRSGAKERVDMIILLFILYTIGESLERQRVSFVSGVFWRSSAKQDETGNS